MSPHHNLPSPAPRSCLSGSLPSGTSHAILPTQPPNLLSQISPSDFQHQQLLSLPVSPGSVSVWLGSPRAGTQFFCTLFLQVPNPGLRV